MKISFIFRQAMSGRAVESGLDGRLTLEDESHFRLDAVQTALGQEVPLLLYADGEYLYLDVSGRKSKLPFGDMTDGLLVTGLRKQNLNQKTQKKERARPAAPRSAI